MSKYVLTRPCFLDLNCRDLLLACQRQDAGPSSAFSGAASKDSSQGALAV